MNIILDTNIILRQPKILGARLPNTKIFVLESVVDELRHRAFMRGSSNDWRIDIVEEATRQGTIMIIVDPIIDASITNAERAILGKTDMSILKVALDLINNGNDAQIATLDKTLIEIANEKGIKTLSENDVVVLFSQNNNQEQNVKEEIKKYENKEAKNLYGGIAIGVGLTSLLYFAFIYLNTIVSTIKSWGTIVLIIFVGIALYVLREKQRLIYGVFEFLVGVIGIIILFDPPNFNYMELVFNISFVVKILGGLYVIVRGLDNIVKSQQDKKLGLFLNDKWGIGK